MGSDPKPHEHEWERGTHMAEAFGVDGRTWACAICGEPKPPARLMGSDPKTEAGPGPALVDRIQEAILDLDSRQLMAEAQGYYSSDWRRWPTRDIAVDIARQIGPRLVSPADREGQVAGIAAALVPIMYDPDWPGVTDFTDDAQKLYDAGLRVANAEKPKTKAGMSLRENDNNPRIARTRSEPPPIDLDEIEMRWAGEWGESDDGQRRAWRNDVAALIDEVRRLSHVSNRYFEEMVRRTPGSIAYPVGQREDAPLDVERLALAMHVGMAGTDGLGDRPELWREAARATADEYARLRESKP